MIGTFLERYWFAIVAGSALAIYMWRRARRVRSLAPVDEPIVDAEAPRAGTTRAPPRVVTRIAVVVCLLAFIAAIKYRHQVALVQPVATDYLVVAIIGGVIAMAILRRRETLPAEARAALGILTFAGMAAGAVGAGAVLLIANALLDPGPAREYSTVVATQHCASRISVIAVRGAPALPIAADTMRVNVRSSVCRTLRRGDSVVVVIGPGFFGRPWIQAARPPGAK